MLTIKTVKSYFFNDSGKFLVTWIMVKKNPGNFARVYSGWTVFDDYEKSGIPLCSGPGAPKEANVVQHEELTLYTSSKAHALCIYDD